MNANKSHVRFNKMEILYQTPTRPTKYGVKRNKTTRYEYITKHSSTCIFNATPDMAGV